jgi:glutathione synthase/RimK-type ligase-like ATP-grasp enzyme
MKSVLILAPRTDFHALAIQALLRERGGDAYIVDTKDFPADLILFQQSGALQSVHVGGHALANFRSIWWRRPDPPVVPAELEGSSEEIRFASRECREALWGALHASGIPIFNRPEMEAIATYKPYQLRVAQSCGLRIPNTIITNDPQEVLRFRASHGKIIYKGLSATKIRMTETRFLGDEDIKDLWRLRFSPVIFQEYIERGREYRVTVVGNKVFSAEILTDNPAAMVDWRLDPGYGVRPINLPPAVQDALVRLCGKLGLDSGSIDLRETPSGDLYFLEINPSGQFMFLDIFSGMDVGGAFCDLLLSGRP